MYLLYSFARALVALLSLPWWLLQMVGLGKYRAGLAERLGRRPPRLKRDGTAGCIWIHAVSVGEVLAVSNLVRELERVAPGAPVLVSTTTLTGQNLACEKFGDDRVFFLPLDFGFSVRPYLRLLRPRLLILAETELWPNLLHMAKRQGAAVAIVNARISDRSFPRYRRFRRLFAPVLNEVDLFLAQTQEDCARLLEIGAASGRAHVSGNLKFDIRPSANSQLVNDLRVAIAKDTPVIVCGSTAEGEEELLLASFQQVLEKYPTSLMVLAPRHPERFDHLADLVSAKSLPLLRRSSWPVRDVLAASVFLLDSVGELAATYAVADVAFVGCSLMPVGGHNIL